MAKRLKASDQQAITRATVKQRTEAWKALQNFNKLKPTLTGFARSITGNDKVTVNATSESPYSVGNKIFIRPPLGLGRDYVHNRRECGQRGEDGRQICEACRVRETVDFYLYHEVGHVWLGSQVAPNRGDIELTIDFINEWHPRAACAHASEMTLTIHQEKMIMPVLGHFCGYVPFIFNALEDARVNEGMFQARPGLRKIFETNLDRLMTEGSERMDGQFTTWMEATADAQFMVGLSMMACEYDITGRLHPDVVEALRDERLVDLTEKARYAESAHEITELSFTAFSVAQELGYCIVPKCEAAPQSDTEPEKDDDGESGEGLEGLATCPSPGGSGSNGSEASDGEGSPGDSGTSTGEGSSPDQHSTEDSEGSGSTNTISEGASQGGDREDEAGEGSSTSDVTPGECSDIHENDADGTHDGSGSGNSASTATEGNAAGDDDPTDQVENPDDSRDSREDVGPGQSGEPETGGNGDLDERSDDSVLDGGQSVQSSTEELDDDVRDEKDASSISGSGGESNADRERDSDEGVLEPGSDESVAGSDDDTGSSDLQDSEDNNTEPSEPVNPWDIEAPEQIGPPEFVPELPESGSIEDVEKALAPFLMHGTEEMRGMLEDMLGEELVQEILDLDEESPEFFNATPLIKAAIAQVLYFDDPSINVAGVEVAKFPNANIGWEPGEWSDLTPSETIIGAAVLHARRVFEENKRSHMENNKKSGKINTRVLAKRAPVGDSRLFGKKIVPHKRDHFVIVTGDCSASTWSHGRNAKIRRLMMAQGDILHRTGVPFMMMGHSAAGRKLDNFSSSRSDGYYMYVLPIKSELEGWGPTTKSRLAGMQPVAENLDGHTLEYCRKEADKSRATDVTIIYYTDGEMPAANYSEEREILEREVALCKRKGYHLLAVGINTDSPKNYGMNTVRVDSDEDIILVIKQLEEVLTK